MSSRYVCRALICVYGLLLISRRWLCWTTVYTLDLKTSSSISKTIYTLSSELTSNLYRGQSWRAEHWKNSYTSTMMVKTLVQMFVKRPRILPIYSRMRIDYEQKGGQEEQWGIGCLVTLLIRVFEEKVITEMALVEEEEVVSKLQGHHRLLG